MQATEVRATCSTHAKGFSNWNRDRGQGESWANHSNFAAAGGEPLSGAALFLVTAGCADRGGRDWLGLSPGLPRHPTVTLATHSSFLAMRS